MLYLQRLFDQSDEKELVVEDDNGEIITNLKLDQAVSITW